MHTGTLSRTIMRHAYPEYEKDTSCSNGNSSTIYCVYCMIHTTSDFFYIKKNFAYKKMTRAIKQPIGVKSKVSRYVNFLHTRILVLKYTLFKIFCFTRSFLRFKNDVLRTKY